MSAFADIVRLLPRGAAWDPRAEGPLGRRLRAVADEFDRVEAAAADLLREATLSGGAALLDGWEALTGSLEGLDLDALALPTLLGLEVDEARRRLVALRLLPGALTREHCARFAALFPFTLLSAANDGPGAAAIVFAGRSALEADQIRPILARRALLNATVSVTVEPHALSVDVPGEGATVEEPLVVRGTSSHLQRVRVVATRTVSGGGTEDQEVTAEVDEGGAWEARLYPADLGGDVTRFDQESAAVSVLGTNVWDQPFEPAPLVNVLLSLGIEATLVSPNYTEADEVFSITAGNRGAPLFAALDTEYDIAAEGVLLDLGSPSLGVALARTSAGLEVTVGTTANRWTIVDTALADVMGTLYLAVETTRVRLWWKPEGGVATSLLDEVVTLPGDFTDGGGSSFGEARGTGGSIASVATSYQTTSGGKLTGARLWEDTDAPDALPDAPPAITDPSGLSASWWAAGEDIVDDGGGNLSSWPLRIGAGPGPLIPGTTSDFAGMTDTPAVATVNGGRVIDLSANPIAGTATRGMRSTSALTTGGASWTKVQVFRLLSAPPAAGRSTILNDATNNPRLQTNPGNFDLRGPEAVGWFSPRAGDWVHVTMVHEAGSGTTIYMNGIEVATATDNVDQDWNGVLWWGCAGSAGTQSFDGQIADVAFWDGTAVADLDAVFRWAQSRCDELNGNTIRRTIFVGLGQSKMRGFTPRNELTDPTYQLDGTDPDIIEQRLLQGQYTPAEALDMPNGNAASWSIESTVGIIARNEGLFPVFIRAAQDGTSLAVNWDPAGTGNLYDDAVEFVQLSRALWPYGSTLQGLVWWQGDSDADDAGEAAAYQAREAALFADLRSRLGSSLPIVSVQLHDSVPDVFKDDVRAAKSANAAADANTTLLVWDDLALRDARHPAGDSIAGVDGVGERAAIALGLTP